MDVGIRRVVARHDLVPDDRCDLPVRRYRAEGSILLWRTG